MNVTLVEINIKPERVDEFLEVFRANHEGALQEPGNLRFDVLQDPEVKTRFFIYEAYKDDEAVLAHKKTPHYLACVEKLEEMMSQPRQKRSFIGLLPQVGYPSPSQRERVKDTLLRFFDRNAQGRQRLARRLQHLFALLKGEGQRRFNADRLGVV
ncbi:(4S)-4-hydroxy-5-phosphonooxypentane-2,3-dione isomerase [Klebsiella pneumoniae]|nr:(4S)-4-hydroxy-5-phosphonooxypentane-2,3-dione isomerase [Klebsiella pneumoniae]